MHVHLLGLTGRQRDHHCAVVVTDIHATCARLLGSDDNVVRDAKGALGGIRLGPVLVALGDDLDFHGFSPVHACRCYAVTRTMSCAAFHDLYTRSALSMMPGCRAIHPSRSRAFFGVMNSFW